MNGEEAEKERQISKTGAVAAWPRLNVALILREGQTNGSLTGRAKF